MPESRVSIIIPVFRNAATLRELHARLSALCDSRLEGLEMVFIDDGSPDASATVLRSLSAQDPRVMTVLLRRNYGQHRATLIGLHFSSGERTVIMDADLQDAPESVPQLLAGLGSTADAVFGGRSGQYEPWHRLLTSRIFKWLQHWISGVPCDAGTFVAISSTMRAHLLQMPRPFGSIVAMIGCTGLPITSVAMKRSPRKEGKSAYRWHGRLLSGLRTVVWVLYWRVLGSRGMYGEKARRQNANGAQAAVREFIGRHFEETMRHENPKA